MRTRTINKLIAMFLQFFIRQMSPRRQAAYIRKKGTLLGIRIKDQRKVYIYMITNLFIEVIFENDDVSGDAERTKLLPGLKKLNDYLENEFKSNFNAAV